MKGSLIGVVVFLGVIASCARPTAGEAFLTAPRSSYDFEIERIDSLKSYDLSFYSQANSRSGISYPLCLEIEWVSPQDSSYFERVYMPLEGRKAVKREYRSGMRFPRSGKWTLKVAISPQLEGLRGLGIIWKEH